MRHPQIRASVSVALVVLLLASPALAGGGGASGGGGVATVSIPWLDMPTVWLVNMATAVLAFWRTRR